MAAWWVLSTVHAGTADASVPVRFEYSAPVECPTETEFIGRVRERSLHQRLALDGDFARAFVVTVTVGEGGATARVDFVDADGSAVFRTVRGSTCEEAVSGIALVCALAIDARATPEEPPATAPVAGGAGASASSVAEPVPRAPPPPVPPPAHAAPETPSAERERTETASGWSFSAGAGVGYASHKGPSGAPTVDVFFGGRLAPLGPSARASGWHFRSDVTTSAGRGARFRAYGLRLEACPSSFGAPALFVEPCLATDAGVLSASGVVSAAVPSPRSSTGPWWDAIAVARLGALVSGWLLFEAQGELAVPLVSQRYGFGEPPVEPTVYDVGAAGVSARAGVGFRFP